MKWPDRATVHRALEKWAERLKQAHSHVRRVGYFGSYARDEWGVGSDIDVVLIVDKPTGNDKKRGASVDVTDLPVPADVVMYTIDQWEALRGRMREVLRQELVWVDPPE